MLLISTEFKKFAMGFWAPKSLFGLKTESEHDRFAFRSGFISCSLFNLIASHAVDRKYGRKVSLHSLIFHVRGSNGKII